MGLSSWSQSTSTLAAPLMPAAHTGTTFLSRSFFFLVLQFCHNFLPNFCNKNILFFLQAAPIGNIFLLTILEELKISFALERMSSHKYLCINFIHRRNFKAAENSSSSLAAEATEVSIRASDVPEKHFSEYLKNTSKASIQASENVLNHCLLSRAELTC